MKKLKSINHKGHKGLTQRSQKTEIYDFTFVYFAPTLCALWLKRTFSTPQAQRRVQHSFLLKQQIKKNYRSPLLLLKYFQI